MADNNAQKQLYSKDFFSQNKTFFSATKAVTRKCNKKKPRQKCNLIYNLIISVAKQKNTVCLCVKYTLEQISSICPKIHIFQISFLTKFIFFKFSFLTKITILKSHFSQNSHFFKHQILNTFIKKLPLLFIPLLFPVFRF